MPSSPSSSSSLSVALTPIVRYLAQFHTELRSFVVGVLLTLLYRRLYDPRRTSSFRSQHDEDQRNQHHRGGYSTSAGPPATATSPGGTARSSRAGSVDPHLALAHADSTSFVLDPLLLPSPTTLASASFLTILKALFVRCVPSPLQFLAPKQWVLLSKGSHETGVGAPRNNAAGASSLNLGQDAREAKRDYRSRTDFTTIQACLLSPEHLSLGRVEKRTLFVRDLSDVFPNEYLRAKILEAALACEEDDDVILLKRLRSVDKWHVLNQCTNRLSELFALPHMWFNEARRHDSYYRSAW